MRHTAQIYAEPELLRKLRVGEEVTVELTGKVVEVVSEEAETGTEDELKLPARHYFEVRDPKVKLRQANEFTKMADEEA